LYLKQIIIPKYNTTKQINCIYKLVPRDSCFKKYNKNKAELELENN